MKRGAIGLAGGVTLRLGCRILGQTFPLRFTERAQRPCRARCKTSEPRAVEIFDNGNVEALLGDEHLDIPAPERGGNRRVEQGLREKSTGERKRLNRRLSARLPPWRPARPCILMTG